MELLRNSGFLGESGLTLALEFSLYRHIGQALLLDLGEFDDLGLRCRLEVLELRAGLRGGVLLRFELGSLGSDVLHHGIEVVEFDRCCTPCDRCLAVGGDPGVRLVEIDQ